MTDKNREAVEKAFTDKFTEVNSQVIQLSQALDKFSCINLGDVNWGNVGDLELISSRLTDISEFLGIE